MDTAIPMPTAAWILLFPLAEIAGLVLAGSVFGFWPVMGWLVAAALAGGWLVRAGGRQAVAAVQSAVNGRAEGGGPLSGGAITVMAGVLLIVPGLIGDAVALALLLPPVRKALARKFGGRVVAGGVVRRRRADDDAATTVIEGSYEVVPDKAAPKDENEAAGAGQRH